MGVNYGQNQDMQVSGAASANGKNAFAMTRHTHYHVEAHHKTWHARFVSAGLALITRNWAGVWDGLKNGQFLWADDFDNIVVTDGLNDSLTQHLKGSNYTAAWYVGLTSATPTVDPTDVMNSHSGWTEVVAYDETYRQTLTLGSVAAGSVSNTAAKAVFTISTNSTGVGGCFVTSVNTKSGTTGILYGAGAFSGGNKTLSDNDTLTVTVTLTAAAA